VAEAVELKFERATWVTGRSRPLRRSLSGGRLPFHEPYVKLLHVLAGRRAAPKVNRAFATIFGSREAVPTSPPLNREYWMKALQEVERELDAATTRIDVNAAAKRLMRASGAEAA
jgi:hypothetical protein